MIAPNDPRHGSNAGYASGCRCPKCKHGHFIANKERNLYRSRNGSCMIPHHNVTLLVEPWLRMGFTMNAISTAAGIGGNGSFNKTYRAGADVYRDTYTKLLTITENTFDGGALVYADLTRQRIFSLLAAGHSLTDMPIDPTGYWRTRTRTNVRTARAIRTHYQQHQHSTGPNKQKAAQARNAGHQPPAAWDDPDTLAWPNGTPTATKLEPVAIDHAAIVRVLNGDRTIKLNIHERRHIITDLNARGYTDKQIEDASGIPQGTIGITRQRLGLPLNPANFNYTQYGQKARARTRGKKAA